MVDYLVRNQRVVLVKDGASFRFPVEYVSSASEFVHVACSVLQPDQKPHEEVWVFAVDGRNRIRSAVQVGLGGAHGCALSPSDVFRPVLVSGCSGFLLCHNHPSGDPTPSHADFQLTKQLLEGSKLIGLTLVDHLIVAADGKNASLRERFPDLWGDE